MIKNIHFEKPHLLLSWFLSLGYSERFAVQKKLDFMGRSRGHTKLESDEDNCRERKRLRVSKKGDAEFKAIFYCWSYSYFIFVNVGSTAMSIGIDNPFMQHFK